MMNLFPSQKIASLEDELNFMLGSFEPETKFQCRF